MTSAKRAMGWLAAGLLATGAGLAGAASNNWNTHVVRADGAHVLGNPRANRVLTEFVSYTCPHCGDFARTGDEALKLAHVGPGKLRLEVRHIVRDPVDLTMAMLPPLGRPMRPKSRMGLDVVVGRARSAMLFGFAANLDLSDVFSWGFVWAYLLASTLIWALVGAVALTRGAGREEAVFEAHTGVIGNVGFLGIPMLALLLGPQAVGPVLMVLAVDLVVFSTVLTLIITGLRGGTVGLAMLGGLVMGLLRNPMIVSVVLGLAWGATGWALPVPVNEFMTTLGAAATPCALFALGASLTRYSLGGNLREPALLVGLKTVLHPLIVWLLATQVFDVPPLWVATGVLLAALPAGITPYLFAQRYGACQSTVASAVFLSTLVSVATLSALLFVLRP